MPTAELACLADPTYPGHPLVIAARIATLYPDLDAALSRRSESHPPEALICDKVRGAGGNVYAALDMLGYWRKGLKDHALAYGARYWTTSAEPFGTERVANGEDEAQAALARYEAHIESWLAAKPV